MLVNVAQGGTTTPNVLRPRPLRVDQLVRQNQHVNIMLRRLRQHVTAPNGVRPTVRQEVTYTPTFNSRVPMRQQSHRLHRSLFVFCHTVRRLGTRLVRFHDQFFSLLFGLTRDGAMDPALVPVSFVISSVGIRAIIDNSLIRVPSREGIISRRS